MSDLRLVVFDVDGTLIDSQEFILEAMRRAYKKNGWEAPTDAQTLSIIGLSLEKAVSVISPELSEAEAAHTAGLYRESSNELRAEKAGDVASRLYDGARDALERLHAHDETLLGIATGKSRRGLDYACDSHKIGHFFVTHQTADGNPSKPHPGMLERALYETGCEADRAVMIGDTEFDIEMGKAAGFATIGVSWGYHSLERLQGAGPDIIIDEYTELDAALDQIWARS